MTAAERWGVLTACEHPDQVAQVLRVADVKGRRNSSSSCPIARWVGGADDSFKAAVDRDCARAWGPRGRVLWASCEPGGPIGEFMARFDYHGAYQDLEEHR